MRKIATYASNSALGILNFKQLFCFHIYLTHVVLIECEDYLKLSHVHPILAIVVETRLLTQTRMLETYHNSTNVCDRDANLNDATRVL